jgi:hypothetical protein
MDASIPTGPMLEAEVVIRQVSSGWGGRGPYALRLPLLSFDGTTLGGILSSEDFLTTTSWRVVAAWEADAVRRYEVSLRELAAQQSGLHAQRADELQVSFEEAAHFSNNYSQFEVALCDHAQSLSLTLGLCRKKPLLFFVL